MDDLKVSVCAVDEVAVAAERAVLANIDLVGLAKVNLGGPEDLNSNNSFLQHRYLTSRKMLKIAPLLLSWMVLLTCYVMNLKSTD